MPRPDENLDEELEAEAEELEEAPEEKEILITAPAPAPAPDALAKASWQNVVALQETQNALITQKLSGLEPTLEEIRSTAAAAKASLDRVNSALEKLAEAKAAEAPEETPPGGEAEVEAPAPRKAGPRWRK